MQTPLLVLILLIALTPIAVWLLDRRPSSLRSRFRAESIRELASPVEAADRITDEEVAALPVPVAAWLRRIGVVGRPRVRDFHAVFRAAIRGRADERWMRGTAEQYEFFGPALRLFYMTVRRAGVPVHVFHRYAGGSASMGARLLGLVPVAGASGSAMTQSETVTLLNDMFLLAPGALVDAAIEWHDRDDGTVRATFRNAGHTVSAIVRFDASGDLVDFESDDRYRIEGDTARLRHWSTPVDAHREFDGVRLFAEGLACWTEPSGERWPYARFFLESIEYNLRPPA